MVRQAVVLSVGFFIIMAVFPEIVYAMHIAEGFLPPVWAGIWWAASLPFFILGMKSIQKKVPEKPGLKMLLGLVGAFAFVLSALKVPSITGSSSHMTGVGLGSILFGPAAMSVLGSLVLLFQAMLLAHGGLTTLGANAFSMAVAGPLVSYGIYILMRRLKAPLWLAVFTGAALGDLTTYLVTSAQLALAISSASGGFAASFGKFAGVFAFTQVPLAVIEGLLTVLAVNLLAVHSGEEMTHLSVLRKEARQ